MQRGQERKYSPGELCALFRIDPSTLRRWTSRLGISPHVDPSCATKRYYQEGDVLRIAASMRRVVAADLSLVVVQALLEEIVQRLERIEKRLPE